MQKSNVKRCPHVTSWKNRNETSTGIVFLCDACQEQLESILDKELLRGMQKAVMTSAEVQKMRRERENMRLEQDLLDTVSAAYMVAGFPRLLMLPAPEKA